MHVAARVTSALLGVCSGWRSAPWEMPRLDLATLSSKPCRRHENHSRGQQRRLAHTVQTLTEHRPNHRNARATAPRASAYTDSMTDSRNQPSATTAVSPNDEPRVAARGVAVMLSIHYCGASTADVAAQMRSPMRPLIRCGRKHRCDTLELFQLLPIGN
jgi:hypothetical protein